MPTLLRPIVAVVAATALTAVACADLATGTIARATAAVGRANTTALPDVYISELHYDNTGTDADERIEIAGPAGMDLTGWSVVLYNGSNGATYDTDALTGTMPATCGGRGVIVLAYGVNGIQNGAPDGVALVGPNGVVEFLSYEGSFTAANGPANGTTSVDIGIRQSGSEPLESSLQRDESGWTETEGSNSFGACNGEAPPPDEEPPAALPAVRFSEVHYDNAGTDVGEALEIEGPTGTDLTNWSVVLYNGTNGTAYDTRALAGAIPASCGARGVVVLRFEQDGIQNGGQDGFALVNATGQLVEFLSYEGELTAADGPAAGQRSTDIGAAQGSGTEHFRTLQRNSTGGWEGPLASTLGGCFGSAPVTPVNQVSFSGRSPFDAPLPVGFEDQLFGTLRSPDNQNISTTFAWASLTPDLASIDEDGVIRALAPGTATFRATAADGATATYSLPMAVVTASTTAAYGNHAEFGEPADADASDDFILRRHEFTSSFNRARNIPNWVSYNLDATHIAAGQDRCDCFTYDPTLPAEFQRYTTADYTGAGAAAGFGIDRGHLARSFDRTAGALDNARTFYFSNIIPQAADNNQGPWANFENFLGDLAQNQNREVYIVTGASGSQGTVKDEGIITIPASVWKVAVILPRDQGLANVDSHDDVDVIAVIMPNVPGIRSVNWNTYRVPVNAVESLSGYDVLALLPDDVERAVESGIQAPLGLVDQLVAAGTISAGEGTSLRAKLRAALASLARNSGASAVNQLEAFVREVDAMERSRRLSAEDASAFRALMESVIAALP